jgi:peroxin-3
MFSSFRGFFERHRRKIFITGALLGGAYALGKLAQWKVGDWYETQQVEFLAQSKKQLHFDGNQKTCNTTFYSLLPSLQDAIFELVDSEAITEKLKNKPSDKLLLWEQLKILSFTRTVTAIYASSLLAVFLRVQLNLLGGYMYLDVEGVANETTAATPEEHRSVYMSDPTQKKYLGIVRYFLETGVKDLVDVVQHVVEGMGEYIRLKMFSRCPPPAISVLPFDEHRYILLFI